MSLYTRAVWFIEYMKFFSSVRDVRSFSMLRRNQIAPDTEVKLGVRGRPGTFLTCRAASSDAEVLWDVFWGKYHLPKGGLPKRPVIFDLGANVGFSCFDLGTLFPDAQIFGVELDQDNVTLARRNTQVLGANCKIVHAAVWREDGEVRYSKSDEEWGYHISDDQRRHSDVVVKAVTIDTLMQEAGVDWVDYIKIDIEGAEDEVLNPQAAWLTRAGELNIELHAPATYEKCSEVLTRAGFTCERSQLHKNSLLATRPRPVN